MVIIILDIKNEVSHLEEKLGEVNLFQKTFTLKPAYIPGRHWVAIVDETKEQKTKELVRVETAESQ